MPGDEGGRDFHCAIKTGLLETTRSPGHTMPPSEESSVAPAQLFDTTHWSAILKAGEDSSPAALQALEQLCATYWYPLYAYIRRQGRTPPDAQDLTQEFFARLLERRYLRLADRKRGRFRTFLLTSLKHFLINEWNKGNREKRGGGRQLISLDVEKTETRYRAEPADERTPDKAFDRQWAMVLLDRVLEQLQSECVAAERGMVFDELKCFLTGEESASSYAEIGGRLGMSEGNLKVTVHRLRRRYRELLRAEIAHTVADPEAIDEEIRELFAALGD
jgi:RNA polymerase sigma-70 factor (ECF subfamily)